VKRVIFYSAAACLVAGLVLYWGYQSVPVSDAGIEREYAAATPWPGVPYKTVKAYLYRVQSNANDPSIYNPDIMENGQLAKSVVNPEGIVLAPSQIQKLITAISQVPVHHNGTMTITASACLFNPHHAFVFYDSEGKMVATVEICTLCQDVGLFPERKLDYRYDFDRIDSLIEELGLPVFHQDDDVATYRTSHALR